MVAFSAVIMTVCCAVFSATMWCGIRSGTILARVLDPSRRVSAIGRNLVRRRCPGLRFCWCICILRMPPCCDWLGNDQTSDIIGNALPRHPSADVLVIQRNS
ncbi:hypothetical protein J3F83DRAFT_753220 [Trichoderma novae-zelandiae]